MVESWGRGGREWERRVGGKEEGGKGAHFSGFVLGHFVLGVFFAVFAFAVGLSGLYGGDCVNSC